MPADLIPPDELPDKDYPMVLSTGRMLEHWHTGAMTRRASTLDSIEPEAVALLNARDVERLGVNPGDMISVETRRGRIVIKTRQDGDVPEGMIFIPFCFAEAAANLLTNPQLDPYGKIPEFKFLRGARRSLPGGGGIRPTKRQNGPRPPAFAKPASAGEARSTGSG